MDKFNQLLKNPGAWIPIAMSLTALAFTLVWLAIFGIVHQEDEGTGAHIFQFLMGGQLPIILFFAVRWLPQKPKEAFRILLMQFVAVVVAFAPIFSLGL